MTPTQREAIADIIRQKLQKIDPEYKLYSQSDMLFPDQYHIYNYRKNKNRTITLQIGPIAIAISYCPAIPLSDPDCIAKTIDNIIETT